MKEQMKEQPRDHLLTIFSQDSATFKRKLGSTPLHDALTSSTFANSRDRSSLVQDSMQWAQP